MNTRDIKKDIFVYCGDSSYCFSATFEVKAYIKYHEVDGSPYEDIEVADIDSIAIEASYYDHKHDEWQWRYGENMPKKISKAFEEHADEICRQILKKIKSLAESSLY